MKFTFIFTFILISISLLGNTKFRKDYSKRYAFGIAKEQNPFVNNRFLNPSIYGSQDKFIFTVINDNLKFEIQTMFSLETESDSSFLLGDTSFAAYIQNFSDRNISFYYGTKLGFIFTSRNNSGDTSHNLLSYYLTPIFGAEYFIVSNFSISGDLGLKLSVSKIEENKDKYYIFTTASFLIKWYL